MGLGVMFGEDLLWLAAIHMLGTSTKSLLNVLSQSRKVNLIHAITF